jgi:dihydroflavonol-4-reductase
MKNVLVTGANGHVGNNLVRALMKEDVAIRAGVRNLNNKHLVESLACEVVHVDFLDKASLEKALEGVDTLYQVAAVFKHWSLDEEKEIIEPNIVGTRNILEAAHEAGVKKIVYVSSIAALEQNDRNEMGEIVTSSYNESDQLNPYVRSKTLSEIEAWKVAEELDLNMVTVLPSTIIGGDYKKTTETLAAFSALVNGKMPFTYEMYLNFIDANDIARGMILAAKKGVVGKRYVLSNTEVIPMTRVIEIAKEINPTLTPPILLTEQEIMSLAEKEEARSKETNSRPRIIQSNVKRTLGVEFNFDLSETVTDLGFQARPGELVLRETLKELYNE